MYSHAARHEKRENFWIIFICEISTVKILVPCLTVKYTCYEKFQVYGMSPQTTHNVLLTLRGNISLYIPQYNFLWGLIGVQGFQLPGMILLTSAPNILLGLNTGSKANVGCRKIVFGD